MTLPQSSFASALQVDEGALELTAYLIMPIQRIPRYRLLLQDLLKHTPEDHPDKKNISLAADQIMAVAAHINEAIRHTENSRLLVDIPNATRAVLEVRSLFVCLWFTALSLRKKTKFRADWIQLQFS